jgi:protein-tyrosine phosphatase
MKIIITEDQYKQLRRIVSEGSQEDKLDMYLRRRVISIIDLIEKNIDEVERDGILFQDEFEFADNIISWVVQDMGVPDDVDEDEVIDFIKDEHGEYILSRFNSENDEDDDNDDWEDDDWDNED